MLLPRLGALLLAAKIVYAVQNTSPFLLVSSDPLSESARLQSAKIALTQDVEADLIDTLSKCDKTTYVLIQQDHISAEDFREGVSPDLRQAIANVGKSNIVQIPEVMVMGQMNAESVERQIQEACSARGRTDQNIVKRILAPLPINGNRRSQAIEQMNDALSGALSSMSSGNAQNPSVVIYMTTPPLASSHAESSYEMDDSYRSALHTDLKRNVNTLQRRQSDNDTNFQKDLGLFEKYQFFTPALFMGLTVSIVLLGLLYVGISAVAGLEVSYAAFSREMGPSQQKGKQQ